MPCSDCACQSENELIDGSKANSPHNFEGGPKDILEAEFTGTPGELESLQQQENVTVKNHGNSTVCKPDADNDGPPKCKPLPGELNTVVNPAQPEFGRCAKGGAKNFVDNNCTIHPEGKAKGKYSFNPVPN